MFGFDLHGAKFLSQMKNILEFQNVTENVFRLSEHFYRIPFLVYCPGTIIVLIYGNLFFHYLCFFYVYIFKVAIFDGF